MRPTRGHGSLLPDGHRSAHPAAVHRSAGGSTRPGGAPRPKLSFLVAAWQEAEDVGRFLASYSGLSYEPRELVLCAGGDDGTFELARRHGDPTVVLLRQEAGEGKQRALRKAHRHATGDVAVLTDADCMLDDAALATLVAPILEGEESVVNGSCRPFDEQMALPFVVLQYASQRLAERRLDAKRYHRSLLGRNCALRWEVLASAGAFDGDVAIGTDAYLARNVLATGQRIRFVPSRVSTRYPSSIGAYARQRSRWWRNRILMALRFRRYRHLVRAGVPIASGLSLIALPLAALVAPPLWLVWGLLVAASYANRMRALRLLRAEATPIPPKASWSLPVGTLAEGYAAILTLLHLVDVRKRSRW